MNKITDKIWKEAFGDIAEYLSTNVTIVVGISNPRPPYYKDVVKIYLSEDGNEHGKPWNCVGKTKQGIFFHLRSIKKDGAWERFVKLAKTKSWLIDILDEETKGKLTQP